MKYVIFGIYIAKSRQFRCSIRQKVFFFVLPMQYLVQSAGLVLRQLPWSYWGQNAFLCWYMAYAFHYRKVIWNRWTLLSPGRVSYEIVQDIKYGNNSQRFVRFVVYYFITTCAVECYCHCSDETVHYKSDQMVNFCGFRCATTSPITVFTLFFTFINT